MTPLNPSEKRLLTVFAVGGFILLNLLGYSWLTKRNAALERQRGALETRSRELEMWKSRAPEAEQKRAYLDQNLRPYPDEATREIHLDQFVHKQADELNLTVRKSQPMPVKLEQHFHKSRYTAEVSGPWEDVLEFIFRLQTPKDFRFVPTFILKSQKKEGATSADEPADAVCTFEIEKWWSPESVPPADELTPAPEESPPAEQTTAAAVKDP